MTTSDGRCAQPYWKPIAAGIALGSVVLLAFVLTGHGINISGFFGRLSEESLGAIVPPRAGDAADCGCFGPAPQAWFAVEDWTSWEIVGIVLGGLVASLSARRFRLHVASLRGTGRGRRLALACLGGMVAGLGARLARGCTASVGLSGASTLATAGFLFLVGFFAAGLATSWLLRRRPRR